MSSWFSDVAPSDSVTPLPVATIVRVAGSYLYTTDNHEAVVLVMGVKQDELVIGD